MRRQGAAWKPSIPLAGSVGFGGFEAVAAFGYHLLAPVVLAPVSTLVFRIPFWLFGPPLSQGREDLVEFFLFNFRMDQQWRDQSAKAAVDYH